MPGLLARRGAGGVGGTDGIELRDVPTGREPATIRTAREFILAIGFAPDGRTLIAAMRDGIVQLWDVAAGREAARRRIHPGSHRVALSADGRFVASGDTDAMLRVWDLTPEPAVSE